MEIGEQGGLATRHPINRYKLLLAQKL
jgi:hypothetical protein